MSLWEGLLLAAAAIVAVRALVVSWRTSSETGSAGRSWWIKRDS